MKITAKARSYRLNKGGCHYHHNESDSHRVTGPACVYSDYDRVWYHKDHYSPFQDTGPGYAYLNGDSCHYRIDGKYCSEEGYEDYCKNKSLLL